MGGIIDQFVNLGNIVTVDTAIEFDVIRPSNSAFVKNLKMQIPQQGGLKQILANGRA